MPVTTARDTPQEAALLARITELLGRLASYSDLRVVCLLGLADEGQPHPAERLAKAGLSLAAGATTRQLFEYGAPLLGKNHLDRELRDEVWPRLRELGLVQRAYVLTAAEAKAEGKLISYGAHGKAKSPNNSYALTDEARAFLLETTAEHWPAALDAFVAGTPERKLRVQQAEAVAALAGSTSDHSKLIRACVDALVASKLSDYELVFIDDADGDRVRDEWKPGLEQRNLMPDLDSLWPDSFLVCDDDRTIWFVEGVTTDGEVNPTRQAEIEAWAKERGWTPRGYITAYATWTRAGARQQKMQNLAPGSSFWIADDGGKLFDVRSLAD